MAGVIMDKHIILFRHAKSDWTNYHNDHDRELAKRGIQAAGDMGKFLSNIDKIPELIISSTAIRTKKTIEIAAEVGKWDCPIEYTKKLYATNPEQVLAIIQGLSDNYKTVLLAGHEPTWSTLTSMLIGGGSIDFPTAGMLRMSFHVHHWQTVSYGIGRLDWFMRPKLLNIKKTPEN